SGETTTDVFRSPDLFGLIEATSNAGPFSCALTVGELAMPIANAAMPANMSAFVNISYQTLRRSYTSLVTELLPGRPDNSLVPGGLLHAVDDEDLNQTLCGFQFKPRVLLERHEW